MDQSKQKAIDDFEKAISSYKKMIAAVDLLPDGLDSCIWSAGFDLNIDIPWDVARLRRIREKLGSDWKLLYKPILMDQGALSFHYEHTSGVYLRIYMEAVKEGSTCRRVQVGKKIVPVYKVVCDDKTESTEAIEIELKGQSDL